MQPIMCCLNRWCQSTGRKRVYYVWSDRVLVFWPQYENGSRSWSVWKITLSPKSYIGWWDYFLRFVGLLDLWKGELEKAARNVQGIWGKHSLWPTFSTKCSVVLAPGQTGTPWANPAWIPEDQALPCLKFIKGSLQFILGWIFLKPKQLPVYPLELFRAFLGAYRCGYIRPGRTLGLFSLSL